MLIQTHKFSCKQFVQHFMEGHAKSGPISRLPLVTISDSSNLLRDVPVCQVTATAFNIFAYYDFFLTL
jgi:hypothetical protein